MFDFEGLNILAIVIAFIVNVVIGAFWYSPAGFGKKWSKLTGVDMMKTPKKETNRAIIFVAISSLLQAFILALVLNTLAPATVFEAITSTLIIWFGLTAITTIGNTLYQRQSLKLWWINASFFLVVMVINAIVIFYV